MAVSKGVIISVVLVVGFFILVFVGVAGFFGWRYYQSHVAARVAELATPAPETTPADGAAPAGEPTADTAATAEPTAEATAEPTAEPAAETTAAPAPKTSAPRKATRAPKTAAPKAAPTEAPTEPPKPTAPKIQVYEISHVHGGFSKKTCSGLLQLLDTGFKYDAQTSEDDHLDHVVYRFDQIKKVELKDPKTVEVVAVDRKWTFRGDGLIVSKLAAHLNAHSKEFAGK